VVGILVVIVVVLVTVTALEVVAAAPSNQRSNISLFQHVDVSISMRSQQFPGSSPWITMMPSHCASTEHARLQADRGIEPTKSPGAGSAPAPLKQFRPRWNDHCPATGVDCVVVGSDCGGAEVDVSEFVDVVVVEAVVVAAAVVSIVLLWLPPVLVTQRSQTVFVQHSSVSMFMRR
jgi:hypothetical protein